MTRRCLFLSLDPAADSLERGTSHRLPQRRALPAPLPRCAIAISIASHTARLPVHPCLPHLPAWVSFLLCPIRSGISFRVPPPRSSIHRPSTSRQEESATGAEAKLDELRWRLGKADGDPLCVVGVGAGAWGSAFCVLLQDAYQDRVQVRVWHRTERAVDRTDAERLFDVINAHEDVLRHLIRHCAYLKYVEARLRDRTLHADEILRDGFCLNMLDTPLCSLKVITNLQEAVWDANIIVNGLPSTETREVFEEIVRYWNERISPPLIISLAKGIEASLDPMPRLLHQHR
jgi:hypothetical protein